MLILVLMHQSQKLRKRETFQASTTRTKAWQGQTSSPWCLLSHLGWSETPFTPWKKASPTNEQEGRHKYLSALTTVRNKNSAWHNPVSPWEVSARNHKKFFTERVVKDWNRLLKEVTISEVFKKMCGCSTWGHSSVVNIMVYIDHWTFGSFPTSVLSYEIAKRLAWTLNWTIIHGLPRGTSCQELCIWFNKSFTHSG